MDNCIHWFYLCCGFLVVILALLAMVFNYNLKLKDKSLELEKKHEENKQRCYQLEQKNGSEQKQIDQLKAKVEKLERKDHDHAQ